MASKDSQEIKTWSPLHTVLSFIPTCTSNDLLRIQKELDARGAGLRQTAEDSRMHKRIADHGFSIEPFDRHVPGLDRITLWLNIVLEADASIPEKAKIKCIGPSKRQSKWFHDIGGSVRRGDADFDASRVDIRDVAHWPLMHEWDGCYWAMRYSKARYMFSFYFRSTDVCGLAPGKYWILRDFSTDPEKMTVNDDGEIHFDRPHPATWKLPVNELVSICAEECGPIFVCSLC